MSENALISSQLQAYTYVCEMEKPEPLTCPPPGGWAETFLDAKITGHSQVHSDCCLVLVMCIT